MRLAYYPGCSAKGSSADYEMSTQAVCGALGMRLEELPDWNCCGSTPAHAVDTELSAALCVRNLDIAARTQADMVVTPCPSCLSNLRHAAKRMEKPEFRARVNELLDNPAAESFPPVTSVMQGIAQMYDAKAISSHVKRSLRGLRLVAYYGCLMSRPAELMQFGDPENPTLMEELLAACGAEQYIYHTRIEQAKEYLNDFRLKIYEVAELTGFNSSTHFNIVFKKIMRCTPAEYRNGLKQ